MYFGLVYLEIVQSYNHVSVIFELQIAFLNLLRDANLSSTKASAIIFKSVTPYSSVG